ncbi:MAG: hypothetical protein NTX82_02470 [Candidatus Parcubacteria bacterium]|nr:hypothetical protein [Candidatus Parcubacteria bacterium]
MPMKISRSLICLFTSIFLILLSFNQVLAQTIIEQNDNGCGYQVKVAVVFYFSGSNAKIMSDQLLLKWQQGIERIWGQANQFEISDNKCPVQFNFDLKKIPEGQSCNDFSDYHCITVIDEAKNQRGNIADVTLATINSKSNSNGEWTMGISDLAAAHEIGHLLGLKDEYHWGYQYQDISILSDFEQIKEPGQFWTAYDAANLQLDQNNKQSGLAALSFDIISAQSPFAYAEIGALDLDPIDVSGYKDLYLSGWVYLPQVSAIKSISLNIGTDNQGGMWGTIDKDPQDQAFTTGWNYLRIKIDQMTVYGTGINNQKINTFILRINYDDSAPNITGIKVDNFALGNFQRVWINDNFQSAGPQDIMAQAWGEVTVLPQALRKITSVLGK